MPNAQDIRRRIKSVKNIEQITKAMKMVAAARLRRAQEKAAASLPYTEKVRAVLASVANHASDLSHPLLEVREVKNIGYLVLSADKGLAGAYSSNVIKEVLPHLADKNNSSIIAVGRKARDYFKRRGYPMDEEFTGFSEKPTIEHAIAIARSVAEGFKSGKYDEIHLVYTVFHSAITQKATSVKLLPIEDVTSDTADSRDYIFEPSAEEVLNHLVPQYLQTTIYGALLQAAASELGARMTAMGSATDNAEELIAKLILNYNKIRQATITREISEIVGGAEALK